MRVCRVHLHKFEKKMWRARTCEKGPVGTQYSIIGVFQNFSFSFEEDRGEMISRNEEGQAKYDIAGALEAYIFSHDSPHLSCCPEGWL